tara:strand:- start:31120 stop:31662 length:543 start_codon:yes stop_codon:yes gene_type:complete
MNNFNSDIWIFAYGSLIWRPGFKYIESQKAFLGGYNRSLCVYSYKYRGTRECPGLVLGLDRGGSCEGVAYLVDHSLAERTLQAVDKREIVYDVYIRSRVEVEILTGPNCGNRVQAFTYIANPASEQYISSMSSMDKIKYIKQGHGDSGSSLEYLINTVDYLKKLGIKDCALTKLLDEVRG